jgi:hypothetical protein
MSAPIIADDESLVWITNRDKDKPIPRGFLCLIVGEPKPGTVDVSHLVGLYIKAADVSGAVNKLWFIMETVQTWCR